MKLEGDYADRVTAIVRAGIPVMGHVGFTPQSVNKFGGFKVQGRGEEERIALFNTTKGLAAAGCYAIVLELVPEDIAEEITKSTEVVTIGIGAGPKCSGQIQVMHDVLGYREKPLRHARPFGEAHRWMPEAIQSYVTWVRETK
ncbi:MAG: hypothetical protein C4320_06710 [Armatimonadota bacterium]